MGDDEIVTLEGLRVTSPVRTWCDLASGLAFVDLVAAGEYLITTPRERPALATTGEVAIAIEARPQMAGRRAALVALKGMRPGARSRPESLLRVLMETAGLPAPAVNPEIRDDTGRLIAIPDLAWTQFAVAVEYEGDYHRTDRRQFRRDIDRVERLVDLGWVVLRVTAQDLFETPVATLQRVALRLARRGWTGRCRPDLRIVGQIRP